jgi:Ftsk gamma domain/UvrD-like helicase C-terminal domain
LRHDAQSIYSFRAATIRNILDFPTRFSPPAEIITLERNYRSSQTILAAANGVIGLGRERFTKNLWTNRNSFARPQLVSVRDEADQACYIAERVLENREGGSTLKQRAVLFRTSHHCGPLEVELTRRNIPFVKYGGLKFLDAAHIRDILALLRFVENPRDGIAGFRVMQLIPGMGPASARGMLDHMDPPDATSDQSGVPLLDEDYLILSTIHSAKGQEWKSVFVLNVVDGCIPSDLDTGASEEIEEERRLLYAIKANFPTRVSFQVTSKIDSRTILGEGGAEQLLGRGDMLYMAGGGRITRVHGPFVSDEEVERVVSFLKTRGAPDYIDEITEDDGAPLDPLAEDEEGGSGDKLYAQAVAVVCRERKASTSFVQRHLQIGYNRAARIIERMEAEGIVTAANHVGKREVLARGGE